MRYERCNRTRQSGNVTVRITGIDWHHNRAGDSHPIAYRGTVNVPGFPAWKFEGLAPSIFTSPVFKSGGIDSPAAISAIAREALAWAESPAHDGYPMGPSEAFTESLQDEASSFTRDNGETTYILAAVIR